MSTGSAFLIRQYAYDLSYSNSGKEVKLLSERELCKIYNVSRPTVRKALNELVAEGYLVIRKGLGTFTNPKMFSRHEIPGSNLSIGIIVGSGKQVTYEDYFWPIISAAGKVITDDFGSVRILQMVHDDEQAAREIQLLNLDGIVWVHPFPERTKLIHLLQDSGLPVVCIGHQPDDNSVNNIMNDYFHIGYVVAEYLLARGHRNILFIKNDDIWTSQLRLDGFKRAFADKNLKYDNKLILDNPSEITGDIKKMLRFEIDFTACFAFGWCVWDVVAALKSKWGDNFAEKCEIVSNTSGCGTYLNCPIVEIKSEKLGRIAAEKLMELIAGKISAPVRITLRPEMKNTAAINKTNIRAEKDSEINSLEMCKIN
ncbi:MAG: GntR family transcriptional regulator [Victivallaceae bacterium]|jgi:DNA-binding LacI/PurR family transcriptional regulator